MAAKTHELNGSFQFARTKVLFGSEKNPIQRIEIAPAFVSIGLSDTRGLKNVPSMQLGGTSLSNFNKTATSTTMKQGLHARAYRKKLDLSKYQNDSAFTMSLTY